MHILGKEMSIARKERLQGGDGVCYIKHFMPAGESAGTGRLFSVITIEPGASIGDHRHVGEYEIYYIVEGRGEVTEDGETYELGPGDMMQCKNGSSHSIRCIGTEALHFVALIIFCE